MITKDFSPLKGFGPVYRFIPAARRWNIGLEDDSAVPEVGDYSVVRGLLGMPPDIDRAVKASQSLWPDGDFREEGELDKMMETFKVKSRPFRNYRRHTNLDAEFFKNTVSLGDQESSDPLTIYGKNLGIFGGAIDRIEGNVVAQLEVVQFSRKTTYMDGVHADIALAAIFIAASVNEISSITFPSSKLVHSTKPDSRDFHEVYEEELPCLFAELARLGVQFSENGEWRIIGLDPASKTAMRQLLISEQDLETS